MRQLTNILAITSLSLLTACSGPIELLDAVESEDAPRVTALLADGADPLGTVPGRGTPFEAAVTKIVGHSREEKLQADDMSFDLPRIAILRAIMNVLRDRDFEKIEGTGRIEHLLQLGPFDPDGIRTAVSTFYFVPDDGTPRIEFVHAVMETELPDAGVPGRNAGLPLDTRVRFVGYRNGDLVEAVRIEVIDPAFDGSSYTASAYYFHASTMDHMAEVSWIGDTEEPD